MRRPTLLLTMLALSLMFISCGGEDDSSESTQEHLSTTEKINLYVQNVIDDPSQLPVAFISCVGILTFLFVIWRQIGLLYSLLDAFIVTGLGALIISPIFYQASEPELTMTAAAMGGIAVVGGMTIRIGFKINAYLDAKMRAANRTNHPPPSEEDDD